MVPLRPSQLSYATKYPKYIILHSTSELGISSGEVNFERSTVQGVKLQQLNYAKTGETELPYHFLVDKIGIEYSVLTEKPLLTKCLFLDIPSKYDNSIHIGMIGNFTEDIPPVRLYSILSYKLLVPFIRTFRIPISNIYLHKEISDNNEQTCPGEFFNKQKLISIMKNYIRKISVTRW